MGFLGVLINWFFLAEMTKKSFSDNIWCSLDPGSFRDAEVWKGKYRVWHEPVNILCSWDVAAFLLILLEITLLLWSTLGSPLQEPYELLDAVSFPGKCCDTQCSHVKERCSFPDRGWRSADERCGVTTCSKLAESWKKWFDPKPFSEG